MKHTITNEKVFYCRITAGWVSECTTTELKALDETSYENDVIHLNTYTNVKE